MLRLLIRTSPSCLPASTSEYLSLRCSRSPVPILSDQEPACCQDCEVVHLPPHSSLLCFCHSLQFGLSIGQCRVWERIQVTVGLAVRSYYASAFLYSGKLVLPWERAVDSLGIWEWSPKLLFGKKLDAGIHFFKDRTHYIFRTWCQVLSYPYCYF